jgi:hypothetical protein
MGEKSDQAATPVLSHGQVSGSCTLSTVGHWLCPINLHMTGSLQ